MQTGTTQMKFVVTLHYVMFIAAAEFPASRVPISMRVRGTWYVRGMWRMLYTLYRVICCAIRQRYEIGKLGTYLHISTRIL